MTSDKLAIHYTDGNHLTILESNKIANAINGDPLEDAEEFKQSISDDGEDMVNLHMRSLSGR